MRSRTLNGRDLPLRRRRRRAPTSIEDDVADLLAAYERSIPNGVLPPPPDHWKLKQLIEEIRSLRSEIAAMDEAAAMERSVRSGG